MFKIRIAGTEYAVEDLKIGESRVFNGSGFIRASAITRTSKNNYELYCIRDTSAYRKSFDSQKDALEFLQIEYNENGSLLGWIAQHSNKSIRQGA